MHPRRIYRTWNGTRVKVSRLPVVGGVKGAKTSGPGATVSSSICLWADFKPTANEILVIGKFALQENEPAPDLSPVHEGLRVIVFEQTAQTLRDRLGFRVNEYGLRRLFPRIPDHPILAGLSEDHLHDWAGEATTTPPRLSADIRPRLGPVVDWNGIDLPHIWRCGNRGNLASVLIEKPARGDFRPVLDGGFSLQYAPLMEYREGKGLVVFSQLDLTSRTQPDPAAQTLARNLLQYAASWKPAQPRTAVYLGSQLGKSHLESLGLPIAPLADNLSPDNHLLILAPTDASELAPRAKAIAHFIEQGGHVLGLGLDQTAADALSLHLTLQPREHIAATFAAPPSDSPFVGISPADAFSRSPRPFPIVTAGATPLGDGVLASDPTAKLLLDQLPPWQFDYQNQYNLKRTFRRSSFTLTRLLANQNVPLPTPLLDRFHSAPTAAEHRYLEGLYLDNPEEWDDPYRFFRW